MAARKSIKQTPPKQPQPCGWCENSSEPHELSCKGVPFLCKCKFEKWSQFIDKDCINGHFKRASVHILKRQPNGNQGKV